MSNDPDSVVHLVGWHMQICVRRQVIRGEFPAVYCSAIEDSLSTLGTSVELSRDLDRQANGDSGNSIRRRARNRL